MRLLPVLAQGQPTDPKHVVVVGGGIGGLAAAGRLARAGCKVTVLEKNSDIGGRVASTQLGSCRFDTGPSLLLFRDKYEEALTAMGVDMHEVLPIERVDPAAYRVFFGDNSHLDILNDMTAMQDQLEAVESGAGDAYKRFVAMAKTNLELGVPNFIDRDLTELVDAKGLIDLLPQVTSLNPLQLLGPHDWVMKWFFKDRRLRALFTFQDLYVGLKPSTAPAVFSLLAGTEIVDGVYYPLGGFGRVADAFSAAAVKCGATIHIEREVTAITVKDGAVTGVRLRNGEVIAADVVMCNRDLPAAYELLQAEVEEESETVQRYVDKKTTQLANMTYSAGVISYNWAINKRLDGLLHHNIVLSGEYEKSWTPAGTADQLLNRPNFYVHCPARTDPTAAPPDQDSIMVLLPVANMQGSSSASPPSLPDYESLIQAGKSRILEAFSAVGLGDVGSLIQEEMIITPPEWRERYGLKHGAAFGLAHGLNQLSIFRPANKDAVIKGLYFVGASTRPGNGVPLALISGKLAAQRVEKDLACL